MSVPTLRFAEFRDAGEWEETSMGKVLSIGSGKDYKHLSLGEVPVYGTGGYMLSVDDYLYDGESVCIGRKGTIDKPILLSGKFWTVDTLFYTHSFKKCLPRFIYAYSQMINWKDFNEASGVPSLSKVTIEKIDIKIPGLPEQQKIADCLSSLDELIAAQTQKLDTLKAHKKGLMQQLFSAEGETAPKLRFFEFRDAGEWEENTLGEIATFAKGKGISKAEISPTGTQPCIRYGELYTQYKETINSVISYTDVSPSNLVLSQANDVIIPASGETQIDIATASCVLNSGIALGSDLNIIRSKMNGVFLSYYLNNAKKNAIAELAQGISVVHLYSSQLKTLKINIPDISEQQKIADCLSSIDLLIATLAQKIDALKTHKKGLMQQLFPSADEVAG